MKKKGKGRRKSGSKRTSNPLPKGAKSVRVANPAPTEKKMAKKRKSGKKSKKRSSNPSKPRRTRARRRKARASNPSSSPRRTRRRARARRRNNPSSSRRESGGTKWPGQTAAAFGGGLMVAGIEIGAEYAPVSPLATAGIGTGVAIAATVGVGLLSRSARDGATGAIAAKLARDVRVLVLTAPKKTTTTDPGKKGLRAFGAVSRPSPNQMTQGGSRFVTGQAPQKTAAR